MNEGGGRRMGNLTCQAHLDKPFWRRAVHTPNIDAEEDAPKSVHHRPIGGTYTQAARYPGEEPRIRSWWSDQYAAPYGMPLTREA